jgi:hypothetical protein
VHAVQHLGGGEAIHVEDDDIGFNGGDLQVEGRQRCNGFGQALGPKVVFLQPLAMMVYRVARRWSSCSRSR